VIHGNKLVENQDYHYYCYYLFFFLRIETLNTYENAIKYGYVKDPRKSVTSVEMVEENNPENDSGSRRSVIVNYDNYNYVEEVISPRESTDLSSLNPMYTDRSSEDLLSNETINPLASLQPIDLEDSEEGLTQEEIQLRRKQLKGAQPPYSLTHSYSFTHLLTYSLTHQKS